MSDKRSGDRTSAGPDIIERLRDPHLRPLMADSNIFTEAADEIERLRKDLLTCYRHKEIEAENARLRSALESIEQPPSGTWRDLYDRARRIAREALYGR